MVSYAVDGFEGLTEDQITESTFDRSGYSKAITKAGQLIEQSAPVYKLITSDNWSIIFPLSEDAVEEYKDQTQLHVTFSANDLDATGDFPSLPAGTELPTESWTSPSIWSSLPLTVM